MQQEDRFSTYRCGSGETGAGQRIEFTCPDDVFDEVKAFLGKIRTIEIPTTDHLISHGSYGKYTRYQVTQHKYAGGGTETIGGYIEVLEITNPPDGRCGIVIYESSNNNRSAITESVFTEWETLDHALAAFAVYWHESNTTRAFQKSPGFTRRVVCGRLTPWFYAIGKQQLIGDYAFPEGLQDDPVYSFGRQFVVIEGEDQKIPSVKTCMGTRFIQLKEQTYPHQERHYRIVYWDDGSCWDEIRSYGTPRPRPVREDELWITEAIKQFTQLLAGNRTDLTIQLTDGHKFVGKLARQRPHSPCPEGDYLVVVKIKGEENQGNQTDTER